MLLIFSWRRLDINASPLPAAPALSRDGRTFSTTVSKIFAKVAAPSLVGITNFATRFAWAGSDIQSYKKQVTKLRAISLRLDSITAALVIKTRASWA